MSAALPRLPGAPDARRVRWRVIVPTGAAALLLGWLWPAAPPAEVAAPRGRSETVSGRRAPSPLPQFGVADALRPRGARATRYDLFGAHSWLRPEPVEPRPAAPLVPEKPAPPPLPFSYFGQYARSAGDTVYFLASGDRVYDVRVGEVVDNAYRLEASEAGQLEFTYLPLQSRQSLSLGDAP